MRNGHGTYHDEFTANPTCRKSTEKISFPVTTDSLEMIITMTPQLKYKTTFYAECMFIDQFQSVHASGVIMLVFSFSVEYFQEV
jgi:hypothetical protein